MKGDFRGTVRVLEDGTYKIWGGSIKDFLSQHKGEVFEIKIQKRKTTPQRGYYWVLVEILGKEVGMDKEEMAEICKFKFLQEEVANEITGEIFKRVRSTTELSKMEMAEYIDNIIRWAADQLHIILPLAGEKFKLNLDI